MVDEHLCNGKDTYKNLTENQALTELENLDNEMREILQDHEDDLLDNEKLYFIHGLKSQDRISQIYGMPKVHKPLIPKLKLRPVTSNYGNLSAVASKYIDYYLHKLVLLSPSYTKDAAALQDEITSLGYLSDLISEGTSDAEAMYTNIDPKQGVATIKKYFDAYAKGYKGFFPQELILKLLKLVMTTSIFQFGNSWWKQKIGTAMGTPCACSYATLFFAYYKRSSICPKYKNNLVLYKRYIDDIFFIWKHDPHHPRAFAEFRKDLSLQCKLNWITPDLSNCLNFLDLTISFKNGRFTFKTFQKAMNLYLYIPSHSAHPPGLLKSLIYGLVLTYHRQNTFKADLLHYTRLLYDRLLAR